MLVEILLNGMQETYKSFDCSSSSLRLRLLNYFGCKDEKGRIHSFSLYDTSRVFEDFYVINAKYLQWKNIEKLRELEDKLS